MVNVGCIRNVAFGDTLRASKPVETVYQRRKEGAPDGAWNGRKSTLPAAALGGGKIRMDGSVHSGRKFACGRPVTPTTSLCGLGPLARRRGARSFWRIAHQKISPSHLARRIVSGLRHLDCHLSYGIH